MFESLNFHCNYPPAWYMWPNGIPVPSSRHWRTLGICFNPLSLVDQPRYLCKQCRSWWAGSWWDVSSRSILLAILFWLCRSLFAIMGMSKVNDGNIYFMNSGWKGFTHSSTALLISSSDRKIRPWIFLCSRKKKVISRCLIRRTVGM